MALPVIAVTSGEPAGIGPSFACGLWIVRLKHILLSSQIVNCSLRAPLSPALPAFCGTGAQALRLCRVCLMFFICRWRELRSRATLSR